MGHPATGRRIALVRNGLNDPIAGSPEVKAFAAGYCAGSNVDALLTFDVRTESDIATIVDPGIKREVEEPATGRKIPGSHKTGPLRGRNTTMAVSLTPVAFFVAGLATHSRHAKNTGLLA